MNVTPDMIRAARILMGLTQASFAKRAGISVRSITMVEQGTAAPSMHHQVIGWLVCNGITFIQTEEPGRIVTSVKLKLPTPPDPATLGQVIIDDMARTARLRAAAATPNAAR